MDPISRLLRRLRFRRAIERDESTNVVDGMVKARLLYKQLSLRAHPDKNPDNRELAQELMAEISANRFNYAELKRLSAIVEEKL